jgi:hypothetical protein
MNARARSNARVPLCFYHLRLFPNANRVLFETVEDIEQIEWQLAEALAHFRARAHAHCWCARESQLVLEIATTAAANFLQVLSGANVKRRFKRYKVYERWFSADSTISCFDQRLYLLAFVRHVHELPTRLGETEPGGAWTWSSHTVYSHVREAQHPWLCTREVMMRLSALQTTYDQWMALSEQPLLPTLASEWVHPIRMRRVRGTEVLPSAARDQLDWLADHVARAVGIARGSLFISHSARAVEARAILARLIRKQHIASLGSAAKYFGCEKSRFYGAFRRRDTGSIERAELAILAEMQRETLLTPAIAGLPV